MKITKPKGRVTEIRHRGAKFNIKRRCKNCGWEWFPRLKRAYKCPRCGILL